MVSDLLAIDHQLIEAKTGDVHTRLPDRFLPVGDGSLEIKDTAGHSGGIADPSSPPVLLMEKTHLERSRSGPVRDDIVLSPDTDFPPVTGTGRQGLALVDYACGSRSRLFAAVPHVSLTVGQLLRRSGHQNLIGLLHAATAV